MEIIFFTMVDDCILDFVKSNKSNQEISRKHEFIMLSSGPLCNEVIKGSYGERTKILNCGSNSNYEKGKHLLEYIKDGKSFDVIVKIDMDSVVMQYSQLIKKIEGGIEDMTYMGNFNRNYIRGGCSAMHNSLATKLEFLWSDRWRNGHYFDNYYNDAVRVAGGKMKNDPLFEINRTYTGSLPVRHPCKTGRGSRARWKSYRIFMENMEKYYGGLI